MGGVSSSIVNTIYGYLPFLTGKTGEEKKEITDNIVKSITVEYERISDNSEDVPYDDEIKAVLKSELTQVLNKLHPRMSKNEVKSLFDYMISKIRSHVSFEREVEEEEELIRFEEDAPPVEEEELIILEDPQRIEEAVERFVPIVRTTEERDVSLPIVFIDSDVINSAIRRKIYDYILEEKKEKKKEIMEKINKEVKGISELQDMLVLSKQEREVLLNLIKNLYEIYIKKNFELKNILKREKNTATIRTILENSTRILDIIHEAFTDSGYYDHGEYNEYNRTYESFGFGFIKEPTDFGDINKEELIVQSFNNAYKKEGEKLSGFLTKEDGVPYKYIKVVKRKNRKPIFYQKNVVEGSFGSPFEIIQNTEDLLIEYNKPEYGFISNSELNLSKNQIRMLKKMKTKKKHPPKMKQDLSGDEYQSDSSSEYDSLSQSGSEYESDDMETGHGYYSDDDDEKSTYSQYDSDNEMATFA